MPAVSVITGIAIMSVIPTALQLMYIPLYPSIILGIIISLTIIFTVLNLKALKRTKLPKVAFELYEWPWLLIIGALIFLAFSNGFLVPPTARDLICGPEPIAEYALTEHTFINSVFNQDMPYNNGPFKSLYIPSLQLIYKLIGLSIGKIWVSILSTSFVIFLYSRLRSLIHPMLTAIIIALFLFIPELYAYTYLVLYDYSNMVFFFLSLLFIKDYMHNNDRGAIILASFYMAIATYIRPETLILTALITVYLFISKAVQKQRSVKTYLPIVMFSALTAITYFITSYLYLNYYLPIHYDVSSEVNNNLTDLSPLLQRLTDMTTKLIYSNWGLNHYGYIFFVGLLLLVAELAMYKKLTKDGKYWLSMFAITFFGIAFIGFLLPLADLANSTKRALFKVLPILIIYFSCNRIVLSFSAALNNFLVEKGNSKKATGKNRSKKKIHRTA